MEAAQSGGDVRNDPYMVTIGIRIEFYEKPSQTPGEDSHGYLAAVTKEDAYTAQAVPALGESIGVVSLDVGPGGLERLGPRYSDGRPFLRVREIEHYPEPVGTDKTPGVVIVLHTVIGYDGEHLRQFVRRYVEAGWSWYTSGHPELTEAWKLATQGKEAAPAFE